MLRNYSQGELVGGLASLLAIEFRVKPRLDIEVGGIVALHIRKADIPVKDRKRLEQLVHGFVPAPWGYKVIWEDS